jgi:hypothetical protein
MKKSIIYFVTILCFGCQKYKSLKDDIGNYNSSYIRGRLFLYNDLTGPYSNSVNANYSILTGKTVTISYYPNTPLYNSLDSNYIFATQTDSNGYFVFNYLKANQPYILRSFDTLASGLIFQAYDSVTAICSTPTNPGIDTLSLYATYSSNNNGFWIYFTDSALLGPIPGVNACVFTNPTLPAMPYTSCKGSAYTLTADSLGRMYLFNIPTGNYYLDINDTFPAFSFVRLITIPVSNTINKDTILLP